MSKPNIIVFFTDQQRWDTVGAHGNPSGLTPNLDRLAREGTFFKQAVTPQPVCGPARSCLQTGQYATTTGVWKNGPGLKKDAITLADCFNEAGYETSYIGKWHLSENTGVEAVPRENRAGYKRWLASNCVELTSGPYSSTLWDEENNQVDLPGYRVDAQTDAMIRYIDEQSKKPEQPFLLFHSFLEPHHQNTDDSYPAPDGYEEMYQDTYMPPDLRALGGSVHRQWAGYCGMIKRLDEALGRTLDALKSNKIDKNTIVVFISDHGCHFKTRNAEYKRTPHESSVRIPFVIWGEKWIGGGQHNEPASLVDLMPTLLDSAGIEIPKCVEGNSLLQLINGQKANWPKESYIQFGDSFVPPGRAVRTERWKYAVTAKDEKTFTPCAESYIETELYDLQSDPYELNNLIGSTTHETIKNDLKQRLVSWMKKLNETSCVVLPCEQTFKNGQLRVDYPDYRA